MISEQHMMIIGYYEIANTFHLKYHCLMIKKSFMISKQMSIPSAGRAREPERALFLKLLLSSRAPSGAA